MSSTEELFDVVAHDDEGLDLDGLGRDLILYAIENVFHLSSLNYLILFFQLGKQDN